MRDRSISVRINDHTHDAKVEPRMLLTDFIREYAGLTGTRVGCEHGVCGSCTVQLNGRPIRACLMLAVQANGEDIRTIEGLAQSGEGAALDPLQQAFHETGAVQCGFCTPGMLMTLDAFLRDYHGGIPDEQSIRVAIGGNICRCTGYQNIIKAVQVAASVLAVSH